MNLSSLKIYKITLASLLAIGLLLSMSCNDDTECVEGSGTLNDYPQDLPTFDRISTAGPVDIQITQDNEQSVVITAEPEVYDLMQVEVRRTTLIVDFKDKTCFESNHDILLAVSVPDLISISIAGDSEITSVGDLDFDELAITVSGAAEVDLNGTVGTQTINVAGAIEVENFDFISTNTLVDISGSGALEVYCTENLDINVAGAATISYKGDPRISQNVAGSMTLIDAN